jgi:hypothetical protein
MASPAPAPVLTPPAPTPTPEVAKWESAYPEDAWKRIRGEGIYLGCVLLAAVAVTVLMLKVDGQAHPTARKLLCCGLGGITGSWIYAIRWYVKAVTGKLWAHDFIVWRLTAPFVGIFLAVSTYLIMETGLLGVTFNRTNSEANTYAYAIGFLVGLFSDDVMKKLAEVAKTVFGKSTSDDAKTGPGQGAQHAQGAPSTGTPAGPILVAPPSASQPQPSATSGPGPQKADSAVDGNPHV